MFFIFWSDRERKKNVIHFHLTFNCAFNSGNERKKKNWNISSRSSSYYALSLSVLFVYYAYFSRAMRKQQWRKKQCVFFRSFFFFNLKSTYEYYNLLRLNQSIKIIISCGNMFNIIRELFYDYLIYNDRKYGVVITANIRYIIYWVVCVKVTN